MADNQSSSPSHQVEGSVKEAIGKLTGDARIESEGRRQKRKPAASQEFTSKTFGSGRN